MVLDLRKGGCQGWFSKYHQTPENIGGGWNRFGQRFDRYKYETLHERNEEEQKELSETVKRGQRTEKKIISWDVAPGKVMNIKPTHAWYYINKFEKEIEHE